MMSVLILAMINLHKYLADIPEERPTMHKHIGWFPICLPL